MRRRRDGLVAALRVEPYETGAVLPHERTHAGPKEGRLRLLRAVRTHVEPIFLLYDGALRSRRRAGAGRRARRRSQPALALPDARVPDFADAPLLIADGHHRYETALAFHEEDGTEASAWLLAVLVPTAQKGLTIFPTHRIATRTKPLPPLESHSNGDDRALAEVYTREGTGLSLRRARRARHGARRPLRAGGAVHAVGGGGPRRRRLG